MWVLMLVSSIKTSRAGQALLANPFAAGTRDVLALPFAGAEAFLLEADVVTAQKPPQRAAAAVNPSCLQDHHQFHKRRIRLRLHHLQDQRRVPLQRRHAAAARLRRRAAILLPPLQPLDRGAIRKAKNLRSLASRSASRDHLDHPQAQIPRISLRHRCPPPNESMPHSLAMSREAVLIQINREML